jgi:hypothetical protein
MPVKPLALFTKEATEILHLRDVFAVLPSKPPTAGTKTPRLPLMNRPLER